MIRCWRGVLLALLLPISVACATTQDADILFMQGRFAESAMAARSMASPMGDILAARATLALAAFATEDSATAGQLLDTALADAQRAKAAVPDNIDALLQEAIAVGYQAKLHHSIWGARTARRLIDHILTLAPHNAFALTARAAWHGEAVVEAGNFLAGLTLGAHQQESVRAFEQALLADPQSPSIPIFYAFILCRWDIKSHHARARSLLEQGLKLQPRDGVEALITVQGRNVLAALQREDWRMAMLLVKQAQAFGKVMR